jgi:hypothetical protein
LISPPETLDSLAEGLVLQVDLPKLFPEKLPALPDILKHKHVELPVLPDSFKKWQIVYSHCWIFLNTGVLFLNTSRTGYLHCQIVLIFGR